MKNKYRKELKIINYITTTERYKVIFFVSVILSLYGGFVLGSSVDNFFNSLLRPFLFPMFNVFLFSIIFLNNINVCSIFKKEFPDYILRLKTKKEYIKTVIRLSSIMFLFNFAIIFSFILMTLFITTFNNLNIQTYLNYNVSNLTYLLFYFIRYIIYGLLLTIISTLIFVNTGSKTTLVINGTFLLLMFYFGKVSFINNFSLSIWSYFTITIYSTFSLEFSSSIFMALLLEIIVCILCFFSFKNKRIEIL